MEPLDSEDFTAEQRLKAKSNARNINNQICRLVRIFESKAMQDKLELVKVPRNSNNDISSYLQSFSQLKQLWRNKLCTPKEEVDKIKAQQATLEENVNQLKEESKKAQKTLDSFIKTSNEEKSHMLAEIDALKLLKAQKRTDLQ